MGLRKSADLVRENVTADRTPTEIAESIRNGAGIDLAPMRDYLATVYGTARRPSVGRGPSIVAPSVELDDVTVRVFVGTSDPSFLGTFDRTAGTRMVTVAVHARLNRTGKEPQGHPPPAVDLPVRERIAWTRAVLGDLADYAYRILNDRAQLRALPALLVAFTDATAPRLAPSDFRWLYLCGGRRAYPEKVKPTHGPSPAWPSAAPAKTTEPTHPEGPRLALAPQHHHTHAQTVGGGAGEIEQLAVGVTTLSQLVAATPGSAATRAVNDG